MPAVQLHKSGTGVGPAPWMAPVIDATSYWCLCTAGSLGTLGGIKIRVCPSFANLFCQAKLGQSRSQLVELFLRTFKPNFFIYRSLFLVRIFTQKKKLAAGLK